MSSGFDPRQEPTRSDPAPSYDGSALSIPYDSNHGHHNASVGYQVEGNHEKARITMWADEHARAILTLTDDEIEDLRDRLTEVIER